MSDFILNNHEGYLGPGRGKGCLRIQGIEVKCCLQGYENRKCFAIQNKKQLSHFTI